jgi:hypothetical protein
MSKVAKYAKAVVAVLLTVAYFAIAEGLLPDEYRGYANVAFLVALTYGVWRVPNKANDGFGLPRP